MSINAAIILFYDYGRVVPSLPALEQPYHALILTRNHFMQICRFLHFEEFPPLTFF